MIFDKNAIGTILSISDYQEIPLEWGLQIISLAVRNGFTKYDLPYLDELYAEYIENGNLLDSEFDYIEDTMFSSVDYLNENCVNGVKFVIENDELLIVKD